MDTKKRLIEFVLHGHPDKFKTVLKEEISNRATDLIFNLSLTERNNLLNSIQTAITPPDEKQQITENTETFYPEKSYRLKDGNIGILDKEEQDNISKLYENLNNGNKQRLLKLLSESQESFNRIVKLAKLENKRMNHDQ
jgi:hypothetical protein